MVGDVSARGPTNGPWAATENGVRVERSLERAEESQLLVKTVLSNRTNGPILTRVIEEIPSAATTATPVSVAGGDPTAWRQLGKWVVHEVSLPASADRQSTYLLECPDRRPSSLAPPRIDCVKRADGPDVPGDSQPSPSKPDESTDGVGPEDEPGGTTRERDDREEKDRGATLDGETLLETLVSTLERDELSDERRELRRRLGVSPAERARRRHTRAKLDDLAAYVDALETLVDGHGIDVVDELREDVGENAECIEGLQEGVADVEAALDQQRGDTERAIRSLRSEIEALDTRLEERCDAIEEDLAAAREEIAAIEADLREERQVHARDVHRLDRSITALEDGLATIEEDVARFESFHDRFVAAFRSDGEPIRKSPVSEGDANTSAGDD